ncbi:MarR family winged helix-turn-helix transcriptional regulator [Dactylosporangium sp. NPDC051541]|uniref:MarR family winged helix-turn-helix transcriptional regulator n=1 Tax=Dactylosporangium sp. NPDC051541 TaxID=3363977 RepID=UPI0037B9FE90
MEHVDVLRDGVRALMKVVRLLKQQHQHEPGALAPGVVGLLAVIHGQERLHLKELAAACALDQSTTSRAVSALVQDGLVRRVADPCDGRASFLELTEAGIDAMRRSDDWYTGLLTAALRDWTRADVELFGGLLQRFAQSLLETKAQQEPLEAAR